jgi:hypothetical protein
MARDLRVSDCFQVSLAFKWGVGGISIMHYLMKFVRVCIPSAKGRDCLSGSRIIWC